MQDHPPVQQTRLTRRVALRILLGLAASTAAVVAFARNPNVISAALQSSALKRGDVEAAPALGIRAGVKVLPTFADAPALTFPESGVIPGMDIQRDERTGQIRRVRGNAVLKAEVQKPTQAAAIFLTQYAPLLGLSANLGELQLVRETPSLTGVHLTYRQVYAGLPVFGGELTVHLDKSNAVQLVTQDLLPIKNLPQLNAPQKSERAVSAALAATGTLQPASTPTAEAGIVVDGGTPFAIWRVRYMDNVQSADWDVMVDAQTFRVRTVRNDARYLDGTGMVYETNPVQKTGIANLTDSSNADSTTLTNARELVTLQGLDSSGNLTGTYVRTVVPSGTTRASSATRNFNYTRSQTAFEETMCYYHIDKIERYLQSLGYTNINNRQVVANVNTSTQDNAFYSPGTKQVTFGSGGVDDAEDADVIWHEMGHAIQDAQVSGFGSSNQSGAMGEGFGDYWAGSHDAEVGGPNSPAWDVYCGKWDAVAYNPGTPAYLRVLNSTKHYPENFVNEVHDDGEMWSASLWQVRGIVGKARADKMIIESHFAVPTTGTFADGANAVLAANQALYGGQDQAAIRQIFVNRGFIEVIAKPTNLVAAAVSGTQINLTWTDTTTTETGFRIERKAGAGSFAEITTVGANVTSYSDTGLTPNTDYTYRIRSYVSEGASAYSNEALATTLNQTYGIAGKVAGVSGINGITVQATGTVSLQNTYSIAPGTTIPDNNMTGITSNLTVPDAGTLTNIRIGVNITHPWKGDLEVTVIAPDGTAVRLHSRTGGSADNVITSYPNLTTPNQSLSALNGKAINGVWKLRVRDLGADDAGTLNSWSLTLTYNGTITRTAATNSSGDYAFVNLPAATYAVTPTTPAFTYSPANRSVAVGPDATAQNFTANVSVAGTVSLQQVVNLVQDMTFEFRPPVGVPFTRMATLTASGGYSFANIPAGSYTLAIKGSKWLRRTITINGATGNVSGADAALLGGDANDDNVVDITDLLALLAHYNPIAADYVAAVDFNCDGLGDITDLLLLIGNYNVQGE